MISKRLTGSAFLAGLFVILALAFVVSVLPPRQACSKRYSTAPATHAGGMATLSGEESAPPRLATLSGEESAPPKRG